MTSTAHSFNQRTLKRRKRVDAGPPAVATLAFYSAMKRGSNGSAFICCESCNKDIPAAIADMHDCMQDEKTKAVLVKMAVEIPVSGVPLKEKNATLVEKSKRKGDTQTSKKSKKPAKEKDRNEPKRPPTAFFLFMEDFRKTFKEKNPAIKGVAEVAKCGGEKWKAMSDEEKTSFLKRAADLKENYQSALETFKATKKIGTKVDNLEATEKSDENEDPAD